MLPTVSSDAIVKPVRVEPEGFPVDVTKNWFLCADGKNFLFATYCIFLGSDIEIFSYWN